MNPVRLRPLLAALLLVAGCGSGESAPSDSASLPGEALYARNCIGCHGPDLRGGTASNLMQPELKHGNSREAIFRSIAKGIPENGMPGYETGLSSEQMNHLTDFILARREGRAAAPPEAERRTLERHSTLETLDYKVNVDVWAEGLDTPWSVAFLTPRRALVTEKRGRLRVVENDTLRGEPVNGTPRVNAQGQGGLLDVAPDPEHATNGWIYLSYSHQIADGRSMTRVVRGRIAENTWKDEQVLFEAPPATYRNGGNHYGSRFVFDGKGHLFFTIGERGHQDDAQDLGRPNGKVHRIRTDGTIPPDNPFVKREGALPSIWSYGHRNPQGLAMHPSSGDLWDAEHGPRGGDELNIIRPGANYGWPVITYGINYSGSIITRERVRQGMEQPVFFWRPSTGLCAIDFYQGAEFPLWQNHLLVSALARKDLRLLTVEEGRVLHEEVILKNVGRVRDVVTGPDGAIYVVLNDPGTILRLSSGGEALQ